jgi:uncharacterized protein (DUF305 family)
MAASKSSQIPEVEESLKRVKALSDQVIEASKQSGRMWLDAYENMLNSFLKAQQQAAAGSQLEWVTTVANTNAEFVREMSQAYLGAVREQLK